VKYRPEYPTSAFGSLEQARQWVQAFVAWYNNEHRHSGIQFVTPAQRHTGLHIQVLARRTEIYQEARRNNPKRWSNQVRNWQPVKEVILNPTTSERSTSGLRRSA